MPCLWSITYAVANVARVDIAISIQRNIAVRTHLVTIAPEEVLGPDVHVWVLGPLLNRASVGKVLPMLVPEAVGVDAGQAEGWDDDAAKELDMYPLNLCGPQLSACLLPLRDRENSIVHLCCRARACKKRKIGGF